MTATDTKKDTLFSPDDSPFKQYRDEFEAIMNSIYDEIMITDNVGTVLFVNKASERLYNKTARELVGCNAKDLEKQGFFYPSITETVVKTKQVQTVVQTTKTGRKILVTSIPILDDRNEVVKVVSDSRDMTELLALRQELERKEKLLKQYSMEIKKLTTTNIDEALLYISPQIEHVSSLIRKVAPSDINILLLGESGVGKTMVANVIHNLSNRKNNPFQVINCSAIPETLLESELFGYVGGAFTGAASRGKEGLFEVARGGTIFLDEIGDISPQLQVKLLQVIQDRKYRKIGSSSEIGTDVRIITATNQDLEEKIKLKLFREDLYYRINGIPICIPPLRERRNDIPILAHSFIEQANNKYGLHRKLTGEVLELFQNYPWPGNIRELKSLVERLCIVADDDLIKVGDLPEGMKMYAAGGQSGATVSPSVIKDSLQKTESEIYQTAYIAHKSSYKVAAALGVSQSTAYRKLKKYADPSHS